MLNRAKPITIKPPVLETPESFKGGTFKSGYTGSYVPIVVASIITILITTFNLSTDWITYHSITRLNLRARFSHVTESSNDKLYRALPSIFLTFCILATVIYAIDVIHFIYKFLHFRTEFFDNRDGLSNDNHCAVVRYGGEICVFLLVVLEDLPLSLVILTIQGLISCNNLLSLNHPVFYVCIVSTCLSLAWKLAQVIWSCGCCGKREHFDKGGKLVLVLRLGTLIAIFTALAVTILNSVLIKPNAFLHLIDRHNYGTSSNIFDRVYIKQWLDKEKIVIMQTQLTPVPSTTDPQEARPSYLQVVKLTDIITGYNETIKVATQCTDVNNDIDMMNYMNPVDKLYMQTNTNHMQCSTVFYFHYDENQETIFYDYGYRLFDDDPSSTSCQQGRYQDTFTETMQKDSNSNNTNRLSTTTGALGAILSPYSSSTTSPVRESSVIEFAQSVTFMSSVMNDEDRGSSSSDHHQHQREHSHPPPQQRQPMYRPCQNLKLVKITMRSVNMCNSISADE